MPLFRYFSPLLGSLLVNNPIAAKKPLFAFLQCIHTNLGIKRGFIETSGMSSLILILVILCINVEPFIPCPNSEPNMDAKDSQD